MSELDQPAAAYRQTGYGSRGPGSGWADDQWPGYAAENASGVGNAIRGFPPIPDEPLPLYPPGPFAAWNRGRSDQGEGLGSAANAAASLNDASSRRARPTPRGDSARMLSTATITPDEFDTNHSMPAIKDPILTQGRSGSGVGERGSAVGSRSASRDQATQPRAAATQARTAAPARGRAEARQGGKRSKRTGRGAKRWPARLAVAVAVVIIAAVATLLVITSLSKPGTNSGANNANNKPNQPRSSTSPTPKGPGGKWQYIGTRQTDPTPLTLAELYPDRFVAGGVWYFSAITKLGRDCRAALIGTALKAAVKHAQCSQVLRASYFSRPQNVMATIGVFNLATSAGASAAARHAGPAEFVAVLPGKKGATSRLGQGSGFEEAVVKGHYLVLVWAETVNLSAPASKAQRHRLTGFMNTLVQGTINHSLSYRMVAGKPAPGAQTG